MARVVLSPRSVRDGAMIPPPREGVIDCNSKPVSTVLPNGNISRGWLYGTHILGANPSATCPRCGAALALKGPR